jgi:hypothetical protein
MDSEWIIGALAFLTIGGVLAISIFHFAYFLKDPANVAAAKAVANDRKSAATKVSSENENGRSLRQRLDEAPALKDRLSKRYVGSLSVDQLLNTKWSVLRAAIKGEPFHR